MALPGFKLLQPRTIEDAVAQLARHGSNLKIVAGGTDLLPSMRQGLYTPDYVMDLSRIEELKNIKVVPGQGVEIGALATLSAIEDSEFLRRRYPVLHQAAAAVS